MYQGLNVSRRGLAVVLVLFCIPLFVGLRSLDLETDEAIYSFAVERMLVDGEWLQPKSSPSDTAVFLEKPPLKFWIVAAPIKLGLLPRDEFGLRFWDAVMGSLAFLYIFAIGSRLAGPVCGGVAVLLLFVHWPLVFDHGLRTNNMEAALLLAYCGGVFHFLEWGGRRDTRRAQHAVAATLYFVLGFMTKFVAIAFLPAVTGLGALLVTATRQRLWTDRARWVAMAGLASLLILPWFVYSWIQFGSAVMHTMFTEHVFNRFGSSLDATHLHPWPWYFETIWARLEEARLQWWILLGMMTLTVQAVRRRWFEGVVVVLWGTLPLLAISFGTSKLYHYTYPFLPPLMIAAGYLAALIMMLLPVVLRRWLEWAEDRIGTAMPRLKAAAMRPGVQRTAMVVIAVATVVAVWAVVAGQARLRVVDVTLLKSSGVIRPILLIVLAALIARRSSPVAPVVVALLMLNYAPADAIRSTFKRLTFQQHPLRDITNCIATVEREQPPGVVAGLFVDSNESMWHPITFYFRRIEPWTHQEAPSAEQLAARLSAPMIQPSLVRDHRYREYLDGPERGRFGIVTPPMIPLYEYALLLPGPFRTCSPEAHLAAN